MNYKVIKASKDFGLEVGDEFNSGTQFRGVRFIDSWTGRQIVLFHEAGYLEPIPERIVLKLEVEFEKLSGHWYCRHDYNSYGIESKSHAQFLDELITQSEEGNEN